MFMLWPASYRLRELFFLLLAASVRSMGVAGGGGGAAPILLWMSLGKAIFSIVRYELR